MIKIIFTGPECSGKTTLSTEIAKKFHAPLVKEYARDYLKHLNRPYNYNDLLEIAKGQLKLEKIASKKNPPLIVCDTNLQVIKTWSQIKYLKCDPFILKNQDPNAYYILCYPDVPWEKDPLRENQNNRLELFQYYHQDLTNNKYKFIIARGTHQNRMTFLESKILKMIS
tara:strand:+ start:1256 stop:1762 length:507 start_codon:yes stop_codon:yes gene_type:complete